MKKLPNTLLTLALALSAQVFAVDITELIDNMPPPPFSESDPQWWPPENRTAETGYTQYGGLNIKLLKTVESHVNYCEYYELTKLDCAQSLQHYFSVQYLSIHDSQIGVLNERLEKLEFAHKPKSGTVELLDSQDNFIGWWTYVEGNLARIELQTTAGTINVMYRYSNLFPLTGVPENPGKYALTSCGWFEYARFLNPDIDPTQYLWVNEGNIGVAYGPEVTVDMRDMGYIVGLDGECGNEHVGAYDEAQMALKNRPYEMGTSMYFDLHPKPWKLGEVRDDQ